MKTNNIIYIFSIEKINRKKDIRGVESLDESFSVSMDMVNDLIFMV